MPTKLTDTRIYLNGVEIGSNIPPLEPGAFAEDAEPIIKATNDAELTLTIKLNWWQKRRLKRFLKKLRKQAVIIIPDGGN